MRKKVLKLDASLLIHGNLLLDDLPHADYDLSGDVHLVGGELDLMI